MTKTRLAVKRGRQPRVFYGWWIAFAAFMAHVGSTTSMGYALSVFIVPMEGELGWTRIQISLAVTVGTLLGGAFSPLAGHLVDRFGPRPLTVLGGTLQAGALIAYSALTSLWQFYFLHPLNRSLGLTVLTMTNSVAVAKWFVRKRGPAMALAVVGVSVGGITVPLLAQFLIASLGWRLAWVGIGVFSWLVVVPAGALLLRRRPEDMGLLPDGAQVTSASPASGDAPKGPAEVSWTLGAATRTPTFWMLSTAVALESFAVGGVLVHQVPYFVDRGISPSAAAAVVSVFATSAAVTRFGAGLLAARLNMRLCLVGAFLIAALGMLILVLARGLPLAFLYAVIYGLGQGAMPTLTALLWPHYYGREFLGRIRGAAGSLQLTLHALGPLAAAWLYALRGDYGLAFAITGAGLAAGAFLVLLARPRRTVEPVKVRR